jgi:hypothetical protein
LAAASTALAFASSVKTGAGSFANAAPEQAKTNAKINVFFMICCLL